MRDEIMAHNEIKDTVRAPREEDASDSSKSIRSTH